MPDRRRRRSLFRNNTAGLVPNSLAGDDGPPPQDGACNSGENTTPTPTFESTRIQRCTIFRDNVMAENNKITTPANSATGLAPWGVGVELVSTYADRVEGNLIINNATNGVLGFAACPRTLCANEDLALSSAADVDLD